MGMVFHSAPRLFIPGLALVTKLGDLELVKTPVNLRAVLGNTVAPRVLMLLMDLVFIILVPLRKICCPSQACPTCGLRAATICR